MTDEMKQTGFEVDKDALEAAKEECEHGELSEELRQTIHRLAYGGETTQRERVQAELEELREEKREIVVEKEQLNNREREIDRRIEKKEQELDSLQDTEAEYNGMLESMEADLHNGSRIWGTMPKVKQAAQKADKTTAEVIQDLKDRNQEVPDKAFRESKPGEEPQWKDTAEYSSTKQI